MPRRRDPQSAALSFMDCICCGFGAVLLLFILTAKKQISRQTEMTAETLETAQALQSAIDSATAENNELEALLAGKESQPQTEYRDIEKLKKQAAQISASIKSKEEALEALNIKNVDPLAPGDIERPSSDKQYLSGLSMDGPRAVILLENSGSMLAEDAQAAVEIMRLGKSRDAQKWKRAKTAVRSILAAIPKGTKVAILQMNESTGLLSGTGNEPYIDPYDNAALIDTLDRLDRLEASGGADLYRALRTVNGLPQRPTSLLIITDGLPTAPAKNSVLTEKDRIALFNLALAMPLSFPVNTLLLPFDGDPAAAGLYWKLSTRSEGITLVPNNDWPTESSP